MKSRILLSILALILVLTAACQSNPAPATDGNAPTNASATTPPATSGDDSSQPAPSQPSSTSGSNPPTTVASTTDAAGTETTKPPFYLEDYSLALLKDGSKTKLSENTKKLTVLNFWASWCHFCVQEMPDLIEISKRDDVRVIFINAGEDKQTVENFMKNNNYDFEVHTDVDDTMTRFFGITGLPTSIFIGEDRELYYIHRGLMDVAMFDEVKKAVDEYIAKRSQP